MFKPAESYGHFSVGGCSGSDGFDLTYSTNNGYRQTIRYRLPETHAHAGRRLDVPVILLIVVAYLAAFANSLIWPKFFVVYLLYCSIDTLFERQVKSWHWVEHQAAMWLESKRPDINDIDPISTRCGSVLLMAKGMFLTTSVMVIWDYGFPALPLQLSALALWKARDCMDDLLMMRPWLRRSIAVVAWPMAFIALLLQRVLYMRRPTTEQTEIARTWACRTAPLIADALLSEPMQQRPIVIFYRSGDSR